MARRKLLPLLLTAPMLLLLLAPVLQPPVNHPSTAYNERPVFVRFGQWMPHHVGRPQGGGFSSNGLHQVIRFDRAPGEARRGTVQFESRQWISWRPDSKGHWAEKSWFDGVAIAFDLAAPAAEPG
jgi:hypothetical protein